MTHLLSQVIPNFAPQTEGVVQYILPKKRHTTGKIAIELSNDNRVEIVGVLLQSSTEKDSQQYCVYLALNQADINLDDLSIWNILPSKILRRRTEAEGPSNSGPLDTAVLEVFIQQIGIEPDPIEKAIIGNMKIEISGTLGKSKKNTRKITVNNVEFPIKPGK